MDVERFKIILRNGLASKASRLVLKDGVPPEMTIGQASSAMPGEAPIDSALLKNLYAFLFPADKDNLANRKNVRGALNVPNVGKVQLIAIPQDPASLRLYLPPAGDSLCEIDWQQLQAPTGAQTSSPIATPPKAAEAPPGAPIIQPPPAFAPPVVEPAPSVVAPQLKTEAPLEGSSNDGSKSTPKPAADVGIDAGDVDLSKGLPMSAFSAVAKAKGSPPPPPVAVPTPSMFGGVDPGSGVTGMHHMTAADSAKSNPSLVTAIPAAVPPPMPAQTLANHVAAPVPVITHAAPPADATVTISWEAERKGDSSVSDGANPIDQHLADMIQRRASDMHLTTSEPLCLRIDGEIHRIGEKRLDPSFMETLLAPIIPERNRIEFAKGNDTDFAYEYRGVGRFRVNMFRDRNGVGAVLRHIPSKILTAEQLKLPPAVLNFCNLSKGLVVVTGPTGSGKSTTLAAMLDYINKTRDDHLLTVEDPIEFVHPQQKCLVNQREVHKHTGSFARALKAALREDPDIVLIGEMRDLETIAIAIETAETGHLVFGTLHTNTAISTVDRIVDQFPTDRQEQIRMMLSNSLKGVVAQTLLKKKGGGRVAALEILVSNDAVASLIREGKTHMLGNHMQTQKAEGNQLLNEALLKFVVEKVVDPADAFMKAVDKKSLVESMRRAGIDVSAFEPAAKKAS